MRIFTLRSIAAFALMLAIVLAQSGCKEDPKPNPPAPKTGGPAAPSTGAPGGVADIPSSHGGKIIALGEGVFGPYKVKATRDLGPIKAGGDAPIDVTIDSASTTAPKVVAVRFWIGVQDAKGSVKAKADIEDPKAPNRWHTHAEVSDPIPAGAKLWVEIEDEKGALTSASFDLKA